MSKCKYCLREITPEVLAEKKRRKAENARASLAKAKANGNRPGRRKVRDDALIKQLRKDGLVIREIAALVGLSTTAIQKSLKS